VIAPANTGIDNNNNIAVTKTAHTNNGKRKKCIPLNLILKTVVIKFIAPAIDEIPAICKEKIPKSTAAPEWAEIPANGGYTVQPVPTPASTKLEIINIAKLKGKSQKLKWFNLGKDISGAPIIIGTNQLPKAPINTGIKKKKIIIKAWAVTKTL